MAATEEQAEEQVEGQNENKSVGQCPEQPERVVLFYFNVNGDKKEFD